MEENTTKSKSTSINITLYSNDPANGKKLAAALQEFIDPDGNDVREFILHTAPVSDGLAKLTPDSKLFLLHGNSDETAMLAKHLDNKGQEYIILAEGESLLQTTQKTLASLEETLDLGFTIKDFVQMERRGIPVEKVRKQLITFRNGISKVVLKKPAVINDGIFALDKKAANDYAAYFDGRKDSIRLMKFVPASGAASRMFKFVNEFLTEFDAEKESINAYLNRRKDDALKLFFIGLDKLPFFEEVLQAAKKNPEYSNLTKDMRYFHFVKTMLADKAFNYANKPKGILPFHHYGDFVATPIHEHLKECVAYAASNNQANIHFTISQEHLDAFRDTIKDAKSMVEKESGITIHFSISYQHKQTDTIAVDVHNGPFREENGSLVFRPGGHGALIQNLNELDADVVFVKNIDNVSHNNTEVISLYKKALAGQLMQLQGQAFEYLGKIERNEVDENEIGEIFAFAKEKLSMALPDDIAKFTPEHRLEYAKELLNRPMRICGMVKNEGEPGGGPFWIKGENGRLSLQIVESSQVDLDNPAQKEILAASSYFNPVDLVCGLKNYKGEKFDLNEFIDPSTGFIVFKNKMGKDLKGYELPGLWNGAMAGWITVFTEVPLETFNPVKTVNDLLKPAHQPQ